MASKSCDATGSGRSRLLRQGRLLGLGIYITMVVVPVSLWALQITRQVWGQRPPQASGDCRANVAGLLRAVRRARQIAAEELGGERRAVERFRASLAPEWNFRKELDRVCQQDREATRALGIVDLYRYAEEHALRYEARDVARLRRRVHKLEAELLAGSPPASAPVSPARGSR